MLIQLIYRSDCRATIRDMRDVQAIVRSVMEFCFCLGITVVAEGVETVEDWAWLQGAGVRRFQGYLFARPSLQGLEPVAWPTFMH